MDVELSSSIIIISGVSLCVEQIDIFIILVNIDKIHQMAFYIYVCKQAFIAHGIDRVLRFELFFIIIVTYMILSETRIHSLGMQTWIGRFYA